MSAAVEGLIWDLDGTLLDSRAGVVESFVRAARDVFPEIAVDPARVPVGPPIRKLSRAVFPEISDADNEQMAAAFRKYYDTEGCLKARLYENARETLAAFRGRNVAMDIATNKPRRVTLSLLEHFELAGFFRSVMTVDSAQPPFSSKAAMLARLLELGGQAPASMIYVGDTAEDAAAAAACGLRFVWAAYGYGRLEGAETACATINKLADLVDIL